MGGGAFPRTQRLTESELLRVSHETMQFLRDRNIYCRMPPELADKTSFGDVDIVVMLPAATPERTGILEALQQFFSKGNPNADPPKQGGQG